jgi:hypothetical protein
MSEVDANRKRRKTGGRSKGTPNKITATLTDAIDQAFNQVGGAQYLVRVAADDPKAFCALLGKRLPKDLSVNANGSLTLTIVTGVPSRD